MDGTLYLLCSSNVNAKMNTVVCILGFHVCAVTQLSSASTLHLKTLYKIPEDVGWIPKEDDYVKCSLALMAGLTAAD